jgi:hypothetical protein
VVAAARVAIYLFLSEKKSNCVNVLLVYNGSPGAFANMALPRIDSDMR